MELCRSHHDEIVYEGYHCPCCELQTQLQELTAECVTLQNENRELILTIDQLQDQIACAEHI